MSWGYVAGPDISQSCILILRSAHARVTHPEAYNSHDMEVSYQASCMQTVDWQWIDSLYLISNCSCISSLARFYSMTSTGARQLLNHPLGHDKSCFLYHNMMPEAGTVRLNTWHALSLYLLPCYAYTLFACYYHMSRRLKDITRDTPESNILTDTWSVQSMYQRY